MFGVIRVEKILLMQFNSIRSVIWSLPLLQTLREFYPTAELKYLTASRYQSLVEANRYSDEVIPVDKARFQRLKEEQGLKAAVGSLRPAVSRLREDKFDYLLDLQNDGASNFLAYLAKARKRITVGKGWRSLFYSKRLEKNDAGHRGENYWEVLHPLGIDPSNHRQEFGLARAKPCRDFIDRLLAKHSIQPQTTLVVISPGTGGKNCWPVEKYARLSSWIAEELDGRAVIAGDYLPDKQVERLVTSVQGRIVNLTKELDWDELAEFLRQADAVVGGNNPYLHLAQAVETPALALFGTEDPGEVGPYGGHSMAVKTPDGELENVSLEAVQNNLTTVLKWSG